MVLFHNIIQILNLPQLYNFGELFGGLEFFDRFWIANVVGLEQKFMLFDADGGTYTFLGQVCPL